MATGIVLTLGASTNATYTSKTNAKLIVTAGNASATINGAGLTNSMNPSGLMYIGAGQSISIASGTTAFILSQYEE